MKQYAHIPALVLSSTTIALLLPAPGDAVALFGDLSETTVFDSNVYSDASNEWDVAVQASGNLTLEFADIYEAGYLGFVEIFPRHSDLLFHTHELYLFANPVFGARGRSEFVAELSMRAQRNDDAYASVNLASPTLYLELGFQPADWIALSASELVSYRWFYEDTPADGLDSWTQGEISFTAPSRTTVKTRVVYGQRYYPRITGPAATDPLDQSLEAGIRVAQNLFEGGGVRVDYAYIHGFGTSATVVRNIDEAAFQYLGEAFLLTAHQALAGLKLLFRVGVSVDAVVRFADKRYNGWPARDGVGDPTGETRRDRELGPAVRLAYRHGRSADASPAAPSPEISLGYEYERNWSNDTWYDMDRHRAMLGFELAW